jgi:endonuclease/exonuclease/phosphatase family metal-dependent hydrolase
VASYNVENLFDAYYNGTEYEEYIPGKHNWNKRMVEIKINHTTQVICDLNADVLGLQEIENKEIFNALKNKLKKVGCGYKYSAITSKKGASIQVALLSRFPIVKQHDISVSYSPRVRNILEVEIEVQKHRLTLFVNHWKSKAYKGYESKRIKYAKALQARIARLAPRKEYIIIGDFNSDYNAYLTLDDKINDTEGKTGFSDILKTKIEEYQILHAKKGEHYTLWKELPIAKRWSHKFYGKKSSLDQIVLPQNMFDARGIDYVNNSFSVYKAKYLFTKRGYINRWRYKNGKHMAKGYSDHLPVYAYFDTQAYKSLEGEQKIHQIEEKSIAALYLHENIENSVLLKNVLVLMKRGRNAIIKQTKKGRGIYLYGCASKLKEGYRYDILVESIKGYHGLKEIISAYNIKKYGKVSLKKFYKKSFDNLKQNEVISKVVGIYKNKKIYINGKDIPIYFKKKKFTPPNGTKLKIHYAHLGYYKQLQLVIHSRKDFEIVE